MKLDYDPELLDTLLQKLFDESLEEAEIDALNANLFKSQYARRHYRKSLRLHASLIRHRQVEKVLSIKPLVPSRRYWPAALGIAATIALLATFILGTVGTQDMRSSLATESSPTLASGPAAMLTGSSAAIWSSATPPQALDRPLELLTGFAEITYQNGVRVILEGPCRFEVTSETSMEVAHGRATVKVPHPVNGFHLDTPAGRITDLGTEFGVAVGSAAEGPVIFAAVFDGEIEIPAENTPRKRLLSGDSLAIVRDRGNTRLISTFGNYPVDLADSARRLPTSPSGTLEAGNLALAKPVTSPAYYNSELGAVFPPSTLTDGRLNDTGSPGDWSFWLAPNGDSGEFTVDLLTAQSIARIDLQNTRNRIYGDRGIREIQILTSTDGTHFHEILRTELKPIAESPAPGVEFPFESFNFPAVDARFVKVIGHSHYRHPDRPADHLDQGGGLNEIRIFAR